MKVSTKSGDTGTTSVCNARIHKTSILIEALGELDMCIAECILLSTKWDSLSSTSKHIVEDLNCICSIISGYKNEQEFPFEKTLWLENEMNQEAIKETFQFVYPFHDEKAASINRLRTLIRHCELTLFKLNIEQPVSQLILNYMNRLSDFWFILGSTEYLNKVKKENDV